MAVQGAEKYIPRGNDMTSAFAVVQARYSPVLSAARVMSAETLAQNVALLKQVTTDHLTAGIAFLANRGDSALEEIGTSAWWSINRRRALVALTNDIPQALAHFGMPLEMARELGGDGEAHVLHTEVESGIDKVYLPVVFLHPAFLLRTSNQPVEALGMIAWICSHLKDGANGRFREDPQNLNLRAEALEAHVLVEALKQNPTLRLSMQAHDFIRQYPDGIHSLPSGLHYVGKPDTKGFDFNSN